MTIESRSQLCSGAPQRFSGPLSDSEAEPMRPKFRSTPAAWAVAAIAMTLVAILLYANLTSSWSGGHDMATGTRWELGVRRGHLAL